MSRSLRRLCIPLFLHAALAGLWAPAAGAQPAEPQASHPFAASRPIAERYIVTFVAGVANPAAEAASQMRGVGAGGQLHHVYTAAIKGFAATLPDSAVAALRNNPNVQAIEQDQTVSLVTNHLETQTQATWGLDRIDQDVPYLDSRYHYWTGAGRGVTAFIIDTGIRANHDDFGGRVLLPGYTSIADNRGSDDCNGHGTHVSGTVGGRTWGVAKQVTLVPVRVLDCRGSGTWSGVIAGIDWVAGDINSALRPAVANMSLGGGKSSAVNAAVAGAVVKGVTMVVAAGNSSADACNYSPASEPSALTVGATTKGDARASYSNYGTCVDLFAPGSSITSAWNTSSNATNTISGTSMASPHVTGAAALAVQANPGATPTAIGWFLVSSATPNRIGSVGSGSPNLLLYSLATGTVTEPPWPVIAIRAMTGSASLSKNGRSWQAKATATVGEVFGTQPLMANVSVNGTFAPGGKASCVTAATGSCTLTSAAISSPMPPTMTTFTVDSLSGYHMLYQQSYNYNQPAQITITIP